METVSLQFEDQPPVTIPLEVAKAEYEALSKVELPHLEDQRLLRALVAAIGEFPKLPLGLMPDGRTRAENQIEQWRKDYAELN